MKTLISELKFDENEALDFEQLKILLKGRVSGLKVKYVDLETVTKQYVLSDFLPSHVNASLILLTAVVSGRTQRHWTCLIRHKDNSLSFFDSMAFGFHTLSHLLQDNMKFANFMRRIKAKPNKKQIQKEASMIKTCGLHCVVRLVKHELKSNEYDHWLHGFRMDTDLLIAVLTYIGHLSVQ